MKRTLVTVVISALLLTGLLAAAADDGSDASPPLFRPITGKAAGARSPAAVATRPIAVDPSQLAAAQAVLHFELLDGAVHRAQARTVERRGQGEVTWYGTIGGVEEQQVILTLHQGLMVGLIYAPSGVYQIAADAAGGQQLSLIDQSRLPPGAEPIVPPVAPKSPLPGSDAAPAKADDDLANDMRVMILYTPDARDAAGGLANIEAIAQSGIDLTNVSYLNSGVFARCNLVYTGEAPNGYNDSGSVHSDLTWLRTNASVAALRNTHAADLVSLLVAAGDYCGVGYMMETVSPTFEQYAFQVTDEECVIPSLAWTHEHGHNVGFDHNPEDGDPPGGKTYPWSYGHFEDANFRTVMSYWRLCGVFGCPVVPYFSNPDRELWGMPMGIVDERDNARTGNLTAPVVANFRSGDGRSRAVVGVWQHSGQAWNDAEHSDIRAAAVAQGHTVEADGGISAATLANDDVFVIGEPTAVPSAEELADLASFVESGGTLLLFEDAGCGSCSKANEILTGIGCNLCLLPESAASITAFPAGLELTGGPPFTPYDITGQTLTTDGSGTKVSGCSPLAGDYLAWEPIGHGAVLVFGDRSDHNIHVDPAAAQVNTQLFLNLLAHPARGVVMTRWDGIFSYRAFRFNLEVLASTPLTIVGFDVVLPGWSTNTLDVYYRELAQDPWTLLGSDATVVGKGWYLPTPVNVGGLTLLPGQTYQIMIDVGSYDQNPIPMMAAIGSATYASPELRISGSCGTDDPMSTGCSSSYQWNGAVYYAGRSNLIFSDGFESGDPTAWTATVQ